MSRMADMQTENANIMEQQREWQEQRAQAGEDPNDWHAFREHLQAIGAPDPGEEEPADFRHESGAEDFQTQRESQPI